MEIQEGRRENEVSESTACAQHVLLIPQSTVSHGLPLLKVATQIASHGIRVSFVAYSDVIPSLSVHLPSAEERPQHARNFRFFELPRPQDTTVPYHEFEFQEALQPFVEKFARDKQNGVPGGPTCIVVDMFVPWTQDLSGLLKIPRYVLITSGLIFGKFLLEYSCHHDRGRLKIQNRRLVPFEGRITDPGLPSLHYLDFPQRSRILADNTVLCSKALWTASGVLFNTFVELEHEVAEAWKVATENPRTAHAKVPATYFVGPLLATASAKGFVPRGLEDSGQIAYRWLISQPSSSVLYVAFGSRWRLSPEQVEGLARGLEASGQRFLWVLPKGEPVEGRPGQDPSYQLPNEFQERLGGRGCIVDGWVPQIQILNHSSTAGFLTHCGWSSVLESILNGVPLIAWPQAAEQRLNCRYLVDKVGLAIEMQTGDGNVASQDQVKDAVRHLLVEPAGEELKARTKEFQKLSETAMSEGGSQSSNFRRLFQDICGGSASP